MKNIFILAITAALGAALAAPAGAVGNIVGQTLADGATVYLSGTGLWQGDEWALENNIARGVDDSVYIAGTFQEVTPSTRTRIFARRISPAGAQVWTSTVSNSLSGGYDYGRGVALNRFGNEVYVLGMQEYAAGRDLVVSRYAINSGLLLSSASYRDTGLDAYDIAVDTVGFVYVAGISQNRATLIRYDEALTSSTVVRAPTTSFSAAYAVAARGGRIVLAGAVDAEIYGMEIWLAGYDMNLNQVWSNTYTPATADHPQWGSDEARAVAIDDKGAIYAAGYYFSQASGHDAWLGKYDSSGRLLYHRLKNGPSNGNDKAFGLALDSFGHVYMTGGLDASAPNRQQDLWIGKYSPAGDLLGEVNLHRSWETGYDVEVSTSMIYAGGGFDTDYGVAHITPARFGAAQSLFAAPGSEPASVRLSWVFPSAGAHIYKIQYSTYAVAWSTAQAQITVSTNIVANLQQDYHVRGLMTRLDHTAVSLAPGPRHFFRVWVNDVPLANDAAADAHVPVNPWTESRVGADEFRVFGNSYDSFAIAREAGGDTLAVYPNDMGGVAMTRFGADGRAHWTTFHNSTDTYSRFSVHRTALDGAGNVYAVGAAAGMTVATASSAWLAKFSPAGWKIWEGLVISTTGADFEAVAFDGAGNVYAGGRLHGILPAGDAMLLAKYTADGVFISSAVLPNPGPADRDAGINALAFDGSNLYAGGYFSYANGTATNHEAAIVRFNTALSVIPPATNYTNVPLAGIDDYDTIYDLAFGGDGTGPMAGGRLYAAGAKSRSTTTATYTDFWVAAISTGNWAQIWSSTHTSADQYSAEAYSLRLTSSAVYAAGYEERRDPMYGTVHEDILLRKHALNGDHLWTRAADGIMLNQNAAAHGLEVPGDGYVTLAAVFNRTMPGSGNNGIARLKEPVPGLSARPGSRPSSVFLSWTHDAELPQNTVVYVQHSTYTGVAFSTTAAQFSFNTARRQPSGELMDILVPGLESGLTASGSPDSPVNHFSLGYMRPGDTIASIIPFTAAAVAATPQAAGRAIHYANGELFLLDNAHGGENPLVRDAQGNIYTAGTFSPWGPDSATAWVRKTTRNGAPVWTRFWYDGYSPTIINALALDGQGNLYAAGQFGEHSPAPGGMPLIKYGPDGRMHWARTYNPGDGFDANAAMGLAVNANGVYVAGYTTNMYTTPPNYPRFRLTKIADTGALINSITDTSWRTLYDVELDEAGNVFAVGSSSAGANGLDLLIAKYSPTLGLLAQLQSNAPGADEAYALALDTATAGSPILYVAGAMTVNGQLDATLNKFVSPGAAINGLWASSITYNSAGSNTDEALGVALDGAGGVYVSGEEARYDLNQAGNLFIRKYDTAGNLLWSQTFNSGPNNEDYGGGIAVAGSEIYAAVNAGLETTAGTFVAPVSGSGFFKHTQSSLLTAIPRLTVRVSSGTASGNVLSGVNVAVMAFGQTGGIDHNSIRLGTTTAGAVTFSLPAGRSYFVAISSHNMIPTVKEQLSDPRGNFFVELNADTTKQYFISPRPAAAGAVHRMTISFSTHTGTLAVGDHVMGEVFIVQTGERLAYGVISATATHNTMEIHNLPIAADGVYGMAVSVPARNRVRQLFMNGAFPAVSAYTADMAQASQLTGAFDVGTSTVPPSVAGLVMTANGSSIENARVRLQRWDCGAGTCTQLFGKETFSDAGGSFAFYDVPSASGYELIAAKPGYENGYAWFTLISSTVPHKQQFNLQPATYTLTGVLMYNGTPLPNATIMVFPDWQTYFYDNQNSSDTYRQAPWGGSMGIRSEARVRTAADGSFTVPGLTDGNARLEAAFEGGWRLLNEGNSRQTKADDIRVTISSQGARGPGVPSNNVCHPGRTWVINSSGTCVTAGGVVFNIVPEGSNSLGRIHGNLTLVTTYTVSALNPLVISTSSPLTVMAQSVCYNGDCRNQQMGFTSLAGTFTGNTTSYSITLSTGFTYYPNIFSTAWAKATSFDSEIDLASTDTFRYDMSVLRSGGLKGVLKLPDGTNFRPSWGDEISTSTYMADIEIRGLNVDVGDGRNVDEYGEFEFPNLAPGNYRISIRPRGLGFVWAPAMLENVAVVEGKTTEVKLQLEAGLAVRPSIANLPEVSTSSWRYVVISVPSGTEMNQKTVTELFFSKTEYGFEYSTSTGWATQYMAPGQYDFYLLLASRYDPCDYGGGCVPSYSQFGNFIGRLKGKAIQKNPDRPTEGSTANPIPIEILGGAVGQAGIAGTVAGSNIFTDADYDRIFSNFEQIFELIPAVMLYDSAGDLKGFANAMPGDEASFMSFMTAMRNQDRAAMRALFAAYPMTYGVWRLPPGRYTVVFNNPNYPPVAKEVLDITAPGSDVTAFNFDNEEIVTAAISGVVRSSTTLEPLAGARVYLKHRTVEKFTMTDSSGAFSFANLPTGIFRLDVMRNGYVTAGAKTGLSAGENETFALYMLPSSSKITGRIYMSKFPTQVTKAGVTVVAYDETDNVNNPAAYLPKTEVQTDASGNFEIPGVVPGHLYKLSAFYTGKMPALADVTAREGVTVVGDITLKDIPPQISIKVRKSPDSVNKVDVVIRSPKSLMTTPSCEYSPGETLDEASAVTLTLVSGPNRTYLTSFTVSSSQRYYTVKVTAGDAGNKMEKFFVYDQVSNAKTEQYIQEESLAGGSVQMDKETEDYSGIELDPGALSYSTATSGTVDYANLVGGFFSALPSVRTVKTAKGDLTISEAVKSLMASEVYNLDLSNASANKPFTLTLKYDKERGAAHTRTMRIYQQDGNGNWNEVPGDYTIDPMLGLASVEVGGLTDATQGAAAAFTPLGRKRMGMSSVVNGRYVPSATPAPQSGRFAVMTAPPTTGKDAYSGAFEIFNLPNPFDLNSKNVTLGADALASAGNYTTTGTVLKFNLPSGKGGNVKFVIYNLAGEKVRTLDMGSLAGGKMYYSEWDGRNDKNEECASGVYFLLPFVNGEKLTGKAHKMAIIK